MKNEFTLAFNEVLEEKQLPKEVIIKAIEDAMESAYRRAVNASSAQHVEARIDPETGKVVVYAEKEVVESVQDDRTEVALEDAIKVDQESKIGNMVVVETTPQDFGRVAAQTARQVIQQRIREAERGAQEEHFSKQLNEIVSGVAQAVGPQGVTLGLDMKAEGIMPRNQMIGGERFRLHDRVRALLLEVKSTPRGPQLILSRAHRNFLRRLLENEVPEIYHGQVEIRSIAREPGQRSKVAVAALQPGVVGIRGVRIQAIVRELNEEKIDVIEWNQDPAVYIAKALSPARVNGVFLNEHARGTKTATVVVPEDQLSLAIGRDGQNARLAAKLTSWRIDIKSLPEAASDALHKIQTIADYAEIAVKEAGNIPQVEVILAKKAEGRPVTPEEYTLLSQFVDRVERGIISQRQAEKKVEKDRRDLVIATIPEAAFDIPLEELNLPERFRSVLREAGYSMVGDLQLQMKLDSDTILSLNGIGPKAMEEIQTALENVTFPEPEVEVQPEESVEGKAEPLQPGEAEASVEALQEAEVEHVAETDEHRAVEAIAVSAETAAEAPQEEVGAIEETEAIEAAEAALEAVVQPAEEGIDEEEMPSTLDELFTLKPEVFDVDSVDFEDEDSEEGEGAGEKKKKKKKKKYVEMEYDPDKDVVIVKRKRKRGGEWDNDWEL